MTAIMSDVELEELNGEVIDHAPTAILPPTVSDKVKALSTLDGESQARAVTVLLSQSRTGLLAAIAAQDLKGIVEFKAKASAIQEMSKQLRLGKELQLDAAEFVRRAERGIGVGIREGQANGTVNGVGTHTNRGNGHQSGRESLTTSSKVRPTDLASQHELHGANNPGEGIYAMTDGVSDEQFEEALTEAKGEGNLSRANVARKAKAKAVTDPKPADTVIDQDSAPAPKPVPKPANGFKKNSTEMLDAINHMLQGAVQTIEFIDIDDIDPNQRNRIKTELNTSLNIIRKFMKGVTNG